MSSVYLPEITVQTVDIGASAITNPASLILEVDGVSYGDQYLNLTTSSHSIQIFPIYEASTNHIKLTCITFAHGDDVPAFNVNNIKVYVVG